MLTRNWADVAMTGEISLRGLVLPARNRKDLNEVSEATRQALHFVGLDAADDAIEAALDQRVARPSGNFDLI